MSKLKFAKKLLNAATYAIRLKEIKERNQRKLVQADSVHTKQVSDFEKSVTQALVPMFKRQIQAAVSALRDQIPHKQTKGGPGSGPRARGRQQPETEGEKALHDSLNQFKSMLEDPKFGTHDFKHRSFEGLVLHEGQFSTPQPLPPGIKKQAAKQCFKNAFDLAMDGHGMYHEGFAGTHQLPGLNIHHAWVVDHQGKVIDNTWDTPGSAYMGIPVNTKYLLDTAAKTGVYGVFGGHSKDFIEILKNGLPAEAVPKRTKGGPGSGPRPGHAHPAGWSDHTNTTGSGNGFIVDKHGKRWEIEHEHISKEEDGKTKHKHRYTIKEPGAPRGVSAGGAETSWDRNRIMSVQVHPEYQRRGLASALYDHIEQHLGQKLQANWAVTDDGDAFWRARNERKKSHEQPQLTEEHQLLLNPPSARQLFKKEEWKKELTDTMVPILALSAIRAAAAQSHMMGIDLMHIRKSSIAERQEIGPEGHRTKSTATDWLSTNPDAQQHLSDNLKTLVIDTPTGPVAVKFSLEYPQWMKDKIKDLLEESFSQPYWDEINDTTERNIEDILTQGFQEGLGIEGIATKLAVHLGGDDYAMKRARVIGRTESGHVLNGARVAAADHLIQTVGELGAFIKKCWRSILGSTTRDAHAHLDGVPADITGKWNLNGVMVRWPGDINLPPGDRCNCQCTVIVEFGMSEEEAAALRNEYEQRVATSEKAYRVFLKSQIETKIKQEGIFVYRRESDAFTEINCQVESDDLKFRHFTGAVGQKSVNWMSNPQFKPLLSSLGLDIDSTGALVDAKRNEDLNLASFTGGEGVVSDEKHTGVGGWVTIHGTHVELDSSGVIVSGPSHLIGRKPQELEGSSASPQKLSVSNIETFSDKSDKPIYHPACQQWEASLTSEEENGVSRWKMSCHDIRVAIAGNQPPPPPMEERHARNFYDAIKKAPQVQGEVFRGLYGKGAKELTDILKKAGVGGVWEEAAPHCMSLNTETAALFARRDLFLKIHTKTGRVIANVGGSTDESEVTGMPNTKYRIKSIEHDVEIVATTPHRPKYSEIERIGTVVTLEEI